MLIPTEMALNILEKTHVSETDWKDLSILVLKIKYGKPDCVEFWKYHTILRSEEGI